MKEILEEMVVYIVLVQVEWPFSISVFTRISVIKDESLESVSIIKDF
jgi:hypothetical protein